MTSIETFTGVYFDLEHPRAEDVRLDDIATALANTCRFGGHVKRFYSVAEHALLVYRLVKDQGNGPKTCLAALHHDSHEAYLGDIPTPLKRMLGAPYDDLADRIDRAIIEWLGLRMPAAFDWWRVKDADRLALRIEAQELKLSQGLGDHWGNEELPEATALVPFGLNPDTARAQFERAHVHEAALL